jgi:hypothetical protein
MFTEYFFHMHNKFQTIGLTTYRDSSVGIEIRLRIGRSIIPGSIPGGVINSFPLHVVQTGSGACPSSYIMERQRALSLGLKRPEPEDYSCPCSVEVTNAWRHIATPPYNFMTWSLIKLQESFTLSLLIL